MTKEEWINIRVQQEMPLSVFYSYYLDKGGTYPEYMFNQKFPEFIAKHIHVPYMSAVGFRNVNMENIIHKIYEYYDQKFNV